MDGIAALPEDVLLEVLSRVGSVKDLFMLAVTSRRWLRRFTDPAFLRELYYCPGQAGEGRHRARLLGFFFQQKQTSISAPTFLPAPGSLLGATGRARALTSFVADDGGEFNYAEPLAARRGIVLMRLVPCTEWTSHHLGLCNPITGERHVLPPLEHSAFGSYDLTSYAIITVDDSCDLAGKQPQQRPSSSSGRFTFSQLLLSTKHDNSYSVYLHSYSAATRSWSAPAVCLDDVRRFSLAGERSSAAVVHHAAAHWLCIDRVSSSATHQDDFDLYKLSAQVGAATTRVSMTKLPFRAGGSPLLGVSGDGSKLLVACVFRQHVRVWTQQQQQQQQGPGEGGGDDVWLRTVIRIPTMAVPEWSNFGRGSMLVLDRSSGVFILDIEKKVMEKVMDCFLPLLSGKLNRAPVAYEMDLVGFFVLQLGGLCRGRLQDN